MRNNLVAGSILLILTLFSFLIALSSGAVHIPLSDVLNLLSASNSDVEQLTRNIIVELRFPRSLLAIFAGAGLALAGANLQMITRNPLADPYLFGISSGASFGVVLAMTIVGSTFAFILPLAAFAGCLVAVTLLLLIAGLNRSQQVESMLLAGVALSFLFSAFTSLMLYWSDPQAVTAILFWTLGSFARADWQNIWLPIVMVIVCLSCMLIYHRHLTALLLGDESAKTLGINVKKLRISMLVISSLLTASIVAICGGIGFVGLMIPHIVRFFIGQGKRANLIVTGLVGGIFMLWVDLLSRTLLDNQELPIGIITSAIGSVFFLALLYLRKSRY